jgi:hypothetical protein
MAEIRCVGVVGAGLMGHGIAQVAAEAGYEAMTGMGFYDWSGPEPVPNPGVSR